ncbi:MAG: LysM peptidoglycan-binding domain-containing protein [Gammaproteobacteria bacterium]|nr:LysM peptidoglycan-binding domain-containing protein [Gammaproteobacteria bacterium]NNL62917.1 LysM peptidoglycan-binding domain-containing protein [Woeseiaceae bacterium]
MSRSLKRISLALVLLLSSEAWAIGLGDINLDSALNEPLRAEIELLSATPEELGSLSVTLASAETFARYGLDRPFYLQEIEFNVVSDADAAVVQVRSRNAITEPFLTFLVEATWSSGRLLREYTVLLDPPTYSPPAMQQAPAVQAPRRATPADSARIERAPQPAQPAPAPQPTYTPPPRPAPTPAPTPDVAAPAADVAPTPRYGTTYSTVVGGEYYVNRGDTLWGIASRLRPDSRLTMNQTMVAIYEANPDAFEGNINRLKANMTLRIPSADNVFQIARADAFDEVKRQNDDWRRDMPTADTGVADTSYDEPAYEEPVYEEPTAYEEPEATADTGQQTETTLELVPPDEEQPGVAYDDEFEAAEPLTREQQIENRIADLETADVPDQQSLIEIRDAELAALREELTAIRGETYEPADDEIASEAGDETVAGDAGEVEAADEPAAEAERAPSETIVRTARRDSPGFLDKLIGWATSTWALIAYALAGVAGLLFWFMRRGAADDDAASWETLGKDEVAAGAMSVASKSTTTMPAPTPDEAIVVVEQDSGIRPTVEETAGDTVEEAFEQAFGDTVDEPLESTFEAPVEPDAEATGKFDSLEDTFSAETAHHLDETDPLAEADFHMAYGLYDQAADLVNGALEVDPRNKALRSKLCEIYFVWGNRDAFVDAAANLKDVIGDSDSAEWDKIVIMGQQIAADHAMFAGAGVAGATKAVDLAFGADPGESAVVDVDFGGSDSSETDIVDLGAVDTGGDLSAIDFTLDEDVDAGLDATAEMQAIGETTVESPTVEQQFGEMEGTSRLPSLDPQSIEDAGEMSSDATAEINLDDLDLDVADLAETQFADLDETGPNEAIDDLAPTGENREVESGDASETVQIAAPESSQPQAADVPIADTDATDETNLLDATGRTQVLGAEMGVETDTNVEADIGSDEATLLATGYGDEDEAQISSDAETMLASLDDDDDFDYASTEALPADVFGGSTGLHEASDTTVAVAGTDVDLDLDDLTAALKRSEIGDPAEELGGDATIEQPAPPIFEDDTSEVETMALEPDKMSDDLHEARTMTEVGTKLDLARAYVDMGDPQGARSILEEVLDEGDEGQRQQAQQLLEALPG